MISSTAVAGWDARTDSVMGPYWVEPLRAGEEAFGSEDATLAQGQSYHESAEVKRAMAAEKFQNIRAGLRSGAGSGIITGVSTSTLSRPRPVRQPNPATPKQVSYIQSLIEKLGKDNPAIATTRRNLNEGHKARGFISFDEAKAALSILVPLSQALQSAPAAPSAPRSTSSAPRTAPKVPDGSYAIVVDGTVKFYSVKSPTEGKWAGYTFVEAHKSDDRIPVRNREHRSAILAAIAADPKEAAVRFGQETGHCGRCGKELTDEASRAAGIGPICASKGW